MNVTKPEGLDDVINASWKYMYVAVPSSHHRIILHPLQTSAPLFAFTYMTVAKRTYGKENLRDLKEEM